MEKQYNYRAVEQEKQTWWLDNNTYGLALDHKPLFSIDTPPPTVSGSLHIGHIFSYTHTDIVARYKRMSGYSVFYPFGFDDNGLPTERYVEKKRTIKGHQLPRSEFIAICSEESREAAERFKSLWQRMGISAYWKKTYATISPETQKISQQSFLTLLAKNRVYRAHEVALYCTTCQTSVAQAELHDKESTTTFNEIAFTDAHGNQLFVATTRPELLPSCVALFYNPNDTRYQHLAHTHATVPLYHKTVPIIADKRVQIDKGTGLVMCCTFGDTTDIEWYKEHSLPYIASFNKYGKWLQHTGPLANFKASEARKTALTLLAQENALRSQKTITHAVNTHERCGTDIEYIMLPQWFVKIVDLKDELLDASDVIHWHPMFMKPRYTNWVEHIGWDWCISRQRFYGIPFPVWHCTDCNEIITASPNMLPVDPQATSYGKPCTNCGGSNIVPDTDVMDTWNTSSLTPYICADLFESETNTKLPMPMSMRPQAHDIIRTWAFYTIIKTKIHDNIIPWDDIVISGHVLSDQKEKISKSKDNGAMDPLNLLEKYPADAIRYWTASGSTGSDVAFSETELRIGTKLITKLWNAFRFIHEHITPTSPVGTPDTLGVMNEWLLHKLNAVHIQYHESFKQYELNSALNAVETFFWQDFCDNYLELIKDQLFHPELYSTQEVDATRWTLRYVGLHLLQLYAPYLPHITEALYHDIYVPTGTSQSIHQTEYRDYALVHQFPHSELVGKQIITIASCIRKVKTEKQVSLKTALASVTLSCNDELLIPLKNLAQLIKGITQAQTVNFEHTTHASQEHAATLTENEAGWHVHIHL